MATNIKVTLEADISKYQQGLKDATAAADRFTQTVNKGSQATEAGFNKIMASSAGVTRAFAGLGSAAEAASLRANSLVTALSGVATVAFISNLLQGASATKDMAEAFGLTIESVLELQGAFQAAGRSPQQLNTALATLSDTAVNALKGNYALRASYEALGISLEDLQTKSAKEVLTEVANAMTRGDVSAKQLTATYDILGRAAKGMPWQEVRDRLAALNGTMGSAAQATDSFDRVMKNIENTTAAVKKEFMILVEPVAEFFEEFSANGENARMIAVGLAAAIGLIAGSAVINGLKTVVGVVTGIAGAFGLSTAATVAATSATAGLTAAEVAYLRVKQAEAVARAQSLAAAVAEARARLAEITATQGATIATAEYAAAKRVLTIASGQLAAAEAAAAATTAALATATTGAAAGTAAAGTAAAGAAGGFAALAASVMAAFKALVAFLGRIALVTAAVIGVNEAVKLAFNADPIDYFATKLERLVKENFPNLYAALEKVGAWFGMAPGKFNDTAKAIERAAETSAQRLERLGVKPNESGGRAPIMPDGSRYQPPGTGDKALAAGQSILNPMAAQEESLRRQLDLLKLQNDQQEEKLKLQLKLVGAGDAEKAQQQAALEFRQKQAQDLVRIEGEIAKIRTQAANEEGGAAKYAGQLALLEKQRNFIKEQKDDTSALTGAISRANQAEQLRLYFIEQQSKAKNQLKSIEQSIADFNLNEDQRRIRAIESMIELEQEAAIKKRQDQLGNVPIGDQERLNIMQEIVRIYEPLIAKQKEYNVVAAEERFRIDALKEINNLESLRAQLLGYSLSELEKFNQALRGEEFINKTEKEIEQLKQQAIERDKVIGSLTAERIARETNGKLMELENSIMGRQFTELEKLEALKAANPEAFARKTQAEILALQQQAAAIDEVTKSLQAQAFARDLQRQGEDFAANLQNQLKLDTAMGASARRRIQIEIEGRNQLQAKLREINDRYGDEKRLSEELRQQRQKEIDDAVVGINKLTDAKVKGAVKDQDLRDSFTFGWDTAFGKYLEDANNAAEQATTYFNTFTRGFEDAIVKFVQTGKLSFKDLANSLIADFARIAAKKAITGIFGGMGGGAGGSIFGNLFSSIGSIFGFANGGNPGIGKPILVGERGPELMIPRNASTIIPNESLGSGGQQVNVVYNIQAVDSSSFRSLVARDPEFIYNVTEQGRKGLPGQHRRR